MARFEDVVMPPRGARLVDDSREPLPQGSCHWPVWAPPTITVTCQAGQTRHDEIAFAENAEVICRRIGDRMRSTLTAVTVQGSCSALVPSPRSRRLLIAGQLFWGSRESRCLTRDKGGYRPR